MEEKGKQPISVPFLWEEKPGTPKKDWTLSKADDPFIGSPLISAPSPSRLTISVPFQWKEKPGKPSLQWSNNPFPGPDQLFQETSALEFLFPFYQDSGVTFLSVYGTETSPGAAYLKMPPNKSWRENCELTVKEQLTLGELILFCRKLINRKKPAVVKKTYFSMEFVRKSLLGSFGLRTRCVKKNTASSDSS